MKKLYSALLLLNILTLVSWTGSTSVQAQATNQTFGAGSYIIDMGVTPQTTNNALRPYALVFTLLQNGIPVNWSINPNKAKDGVDFIYNGKAYRGGPFIISAPYAALAQPYIAQFVAANPGLTVDLAPSSFTAPIDRRLNMAPRWILDFKNGSIAQAYLTRVGIPQISSGVTNYQFKDPQLLNNCDDIYVMPHADPVWSTHSNLYFWNQSSKGAIWAACHAVSMLENMFNPANPSQQANFLMRNGATPGTAAVPYGSHSNASIPFSYNFFSEPVQQYLGTIDAATLNGSEQVYLPRVGWRTTTKVGVWDPSQVDVPRLSPGEAGILTFGPGLGEEGRGKVMYEAGHNHNRSGTVADIAAIRAFMNFSFWSSQDKAFSFTIQGTTAGSNVRSNTTIPLSATVTSAISSAPYTYTWTATAGGTFSNPTGTTSNATISTSYTAPAVSDNTPNIISLLITDACGRRVFESSNVTLVPGARPPVPQPDEATLTGVCSQPGANVTINVLANDTDPDGSVLRVTNVTGTNGTWVLNANNTVTYFPTQNFFGTATGTYTVCDDTAPADGGSKCVTSTITVRVGNPDGNGCFPGTTYAVVVADTVRNTTSSVSVTNPNNVLGDFDYDPADATSYATFTTGTLIMDFGRTVTAYDSVDIYFASAVEGSAVTVQVSYSPNSSSGPWTVLGTATSSTQAGTGALFAFPSVGIRYLRVIRTAGTAAVRFDAAALQDYACIPALPVANNDTYDITEEIPLRLNVIQNDANPGNLPLTVTIVTQPTLGRLSINLDNTISYVNTTDISGTDSFQYRICNTQGLCSTGTVTLNIIDDQCVNGQYKPLNFSTPTSVTFVNSSSTGTDVDETLIRRDRATNNYGNLATVDVGRNPNNRRGIFRFNTVSTIPANAVILSANFVITRTGGDTDVLSLSAYRLLQSWTELGATWNTTNGTTPWTTPGGTFDPAPVSTITSAGTVGTRTFNITSLVQGWVKGVANGGFANNGLEIKLTDESVINKRHTFASSEQSTLANRPRLEVTYVVPQPCAVIPNRAPLANPDRVTTPSSTQLSISALANDTDPDAGNTLSLVSILAPVTGGTAAISGSNILFTPTNTFTGTASFLYIVQDNAGARDTSQVFVTVTNVAPVANNDVVTVLSNTSSTSINVQANDTNPDGPSPLTTSIVSGPLNGTATISGTNILYTPFANFTGRDTITYRITEPLDPANCTGTPLTSTARVFITVNNRAPVAVNDNVTVNPCVSTNIYVLDNDSDPESGVLTLSVVTAPTRGTLQILGDYFVYTPNAGQSGGSDTFTYRICDNGFTSLCSTATVTITLRAAATNTNAPIAVNDAEELAQGSPVYISVLDNDTEPDGQLLRVTSVSSSAFGTSTILTNGTIEFTPLPNFIGTLNLTYTVCDSSVTTNTGCPTLPRLCSTATITITITGNFNPPTAVRDVATTPKNSSVSGSVATNDFDPDNNINPNSYTRLTNPLRGTITISASGGYTYTPNPNVVGVDSVQYRVCDFSLPTPLCSTAWLVITITDFNSPPVATNDAYVTAENVTLTVPVTGTPYNGILFNDSDPDGNPITAVLVSGTTNGTLTLNANGSFSYVPNQYFNGTDTFTYRASDGSLTSNLATVTITITPVDNNLRLSPKVYLQGALFGETGTLMRDDLRVRGLVPTTSPYGYLNPNSGSASESILASRLSITGSNAIVDWVFVELRSAANPATIVRSRSALLLRNGDIVGVDGISALEFLLPDPASFYVAVRHRNHLGVMTATAIPLTETTTIVDFRLPSTPTYLKGSPPIHQAQVDVVQGKALWAGNALPDNKVVFQGTENDPEVIRARVIAAQSSLPFILPFYVVVGYFNSDINMDGDVIFQGTGNDVEFIYQNVMKNHPGNTLNSNNFIIQEQLPN